MYGDLARSPAALLAQTTPLPAAEALVRGSRPSRCQQWTTLLPAADHAAAGSGQPSCWQQSAPLPAPEHNVNGNEPSAAGNRALRCWQQTTVLMATDRPLLAVDNPEKIHTTPHAFRDCLCPSPLGKTSGSTLLSVEAERSRDPWVKNLGIVDC